MRGRTRVWQSAACRTPSGFIWWTTWFSQNLLILWSCRTMFVSPTLLWTLFRAWTPSTTLCTSAQVSKPTCNLLIQSIAYWIKQKHAETQNSDFFLYLFFPTEYGTILKALATPNKNLQGCYLEEMELLPSGVREPILSLQILHSDRSLFVGLNNRVLKIPLERCSTYKTEM